jgi:hypothetical protein
MKAADASEKVNKGKRHECSLGRPSDNQIEARRTVQKLFLKLGREESFKVGRSVALHFAWYQFGWVRMVLPAPNQVSTAKSSIVGGSHPARSQVIEAAMPAT